MQYVSSHFELQRKNQSHPPFPSSSSPKSRSPMNGHDIGQPYLSTSQLLKGKLQLHAELIEALHEFASQSNAEFLDIKSRETVLEKAVVEQNQILDVMQELISTLESENKNYRERLSSQNRTIQYLSGWEAKGVQAEKESMELRREIYSKDPDQSDLKKKLQEKDNTILLLQSRLLNESESSHSLLNTKLSTTMALLEKERVHCIELEEELSRKKDEIAQMKKKVDNNKSNMMKMESEILHLRHEMETLKNFEQQQQDLILKQRASLADKNRQLSSLTQALSKEKMVANQLQRFQGNYSSLLVGDSSTDSLEKEIDHPIQASLFEQIKGRDTYTLELTRISKETELGFSFNKVDHPVSSQIPCLIIKAVKEEGLVGSFMKPGDELIEVNGILCRSMHQSRAIKSLEHGVGILRIVIARESIDPSIYIHSTPMKGQKLANGSDKSATLWATALSSNKSITFDNFCIESSINPQYYITAPSSYAIAVKDGEDGSNDDQSQVDITGSNGAIDHRTNPIIVSKSISSTSGNESLLAVSSKDKALLKRKITELKEQLNESKDIRLKLESRLNSAHEEIDYLQEEHKLTKAENEELLEQLSSYETEMNDVRQYISDLQKELVTLEAHLTDEQSKLASMDNQNKLITSELVEAKGNAVQAMEASESLKQTTQKLKEELKQREEKMKEIDEELQELKLDKIRLVSGISRKESEINVLRSALGNSKRELEESVTTLKEESRKLLSQLEAAKKTSEKSLATSQEDYQHLTTQLKSSKALLMEAEMKETQLKVEVRYLKQAADLANQQLEKVETNFKNAEEKLSFFKQETETKTLEIESLTADLTATRMKLEAKQEVITRLTREVDNLRHTNSKFWNESSQLKEMVRKLELDFKISSMENERLEEKLNASTKEKDEMFQQLEKLSEESTELSQTVDKLHSQLQEFEDVKKKQLGTQADSKRAIEEELLKSLKISEGKVFQQELEANQKKIENLNQQSYKMRSEIELLKSRCETTIKELQQVRTEKEQLVAGKEEVQQCLVELQDAYAKLRQELDQSRKEVNDGKSMLIQLQEQTKIEKQQSDKLKIKLSEVKSELNKAKKENDKNSSLVASLEFIGKQDQARLEELKQSVESKETKIRRLNSQVDSVNAALQKSKVDQSRLATSIADLKQQLEEGQRIHGEEVKDLKDKLSTNERRFVHLNDEFKSQEATNEMLKSKVKNLNNAMVQVMKERKVLEEAKEEVVKENDELQAQNKKLKSQTARLRVELNQLTVSSDTLSSESASLRQQLRQNQKELDQTNAELHALKMNFGVMTRDLKESEKVKSVQTEKLDHLEGQYKDALSRLEKASANLDSNSLDLFMKDEELSKFMASLELRQNECNQLQESVIMVQSKAEEFRRRTSELEDERMKLLSSIDDLQEENMKLKSSLLEHEEEKRKELTEKTSEIEEYRGKVKELQLREEEHMYEMARLDKSHHEAISQLMSTQEEMKTKLGGEKDTEIIYLREEVKKLTLKLDAATESSTVTILKKQVKELEQSIENLQELLSQEKSNSNKLKEEIDMHKSTEREIVELNCKITALDEGLREKTRSLSELSSVHDATESELMELKPENKALLEKTLESANIIAEQLRTIDELRKKLAENEVSYRQILKERDQFLSRVREYEVYQHTSGRGGAHAFVENKKVEPDKLLQLLEQKEEEIMQTRKYTETLLVDVMMKAPFLLEKLNN